MNDDLSNRLLELDGGGKALPEKYKKEITAMLEKTLSPAQRWAWGLSAVLTSAIAGLFAYVALTLPRSTPVIARMSFLVGIIFSIGCAILAGTIAKKGKMNIRTDPVKQVGWMWAFLVVMITVTLLVTGQRPDAVRSIYMVLFGLVFLLFGAIQLVLTKIEQSELNTRERLLKLELRLAEIAESLPKNEG
jgi:quinol-cytochrome oxidoreductase complex cytochrome b subunit